MAFPFGGSQALWSGDSRLPIEVKIVGKGFEAIGAAMDEMRRGVSGKKLAVSL